VTLHDPLTLLALGDECLTFKPKRIKVGLCGETRSLTIYSEGETNCHVAVAVNVERAVTGFMQRVLESPVE
jgi:hypothetical protein